MRGALLDGEQAPGAPNALQLVLAPGVEADPRADDQVLDGARDEHLARPGGAHHARADVHGEAADVVADHLALARMEPGPDLDAELAHRLLDRRGGADRAGGTIEGGEHAVACRLD